MATEGLGEGELRLDSNFCIDGVLGLSFFVSARAFFASVRAFFASARGFFVSVGV